MMMTSVLTALLLLVLQIIIITGKKVEEISYLRRELFLVRINNVYTSIICSIVKRNSVTFLSTKKKQYWGHCCQKLHFGQLQFHLSACCKLYKYSFNTKFLFRTLADADGVDGVVVV